MMRFVVGVLLALSVAGAASAETFKLELPPSALVPPLEAGAKVAPVSFTRMAADLADGQLIAQIRAPLPCLTNGFASEELRWRSSMNEISDPDFIRIFRTEFAHAGLKVSGEANNLFQQRVETTDLQVGALITDFKIKGCFKAYGYSGDAVLAVEWQVYSSVADKVIARISTRGGATNLRNKPDAGELAASALQAAFAENVRQLAANPEFRRIVLDPAATAAAPPATSSAPLQVSLLTPSKPVTLKEAANGAVVVFAGAGSGSGVLISLDGYILTNHHVAGDGGKVRIRWADGSESVGEVVRAHRRRDVALIKVAAPKGRPLAIRRTPVDLGETVFAIGTPLDASLQNTVTKGIVSALRMVEGQAFIQSDTPVTHGNSGGPLVDETGAVVGLTDLGLDPAAGSTINFFIPIQDALKVLAVQPAT